MNNEVRGLVLLDVPAGDTNADFDRTFLEKNEHPVAVCHGPDAKQLCPLLGGRGCESFGAAHGIVFKLDLHRAQHRAILRRYRDLNPDLPIRVIAKPDQARRFASLLSDFEVWIDEPTVADLDGFAAEVEAFDRSRDQDGLNSAESRTRG